MDHGSLKWKPMSSFLSTQTIFLFWLSSSWDGWGFPLGPVGSAQISPRLYYHPQAQPQRTPETVTAHPSDGSHIFQSAQRLYRVEAEGVAFPFSLPVSCISCVPDSSHIPRRLITLTWTVFICMHSSAAHLNQGFLKAKPTWSACKWSLSIWTNIKYANVLFGELSSGKDRTFTRRSLQWRGAEYLTRAGL